MLIECWKTDTVNIDLTLPFAYGLTVFLFVITRAVALLTYSR